MCVGERRGRTPAALFNKASAPAAAGERRGLRAATTHFWQLIQAPASRQLRGRARSLKPPRATPFIHFLLLPALAPPWHRATPAPASGTPQKLQDRPGPLSDHNGLHFVDAGADSYHSSGYRRAEAAQRDPVSQGRAGAGAKLFPTPHAHPRPPRRRVQPNNVKNDTLRLMLVQLVSGGARRGRCGRRSALRALLSAAA